MLHIFAGRARLGLTIAVLIVPSAATADTKPAPPQAAANHVQRDTSEDSRFAAVERPRGDAWKKPEDVVSLLQLWPGNVVADVGADMGYFEPYLARAVGPTGRVLALDVEASDVARLKRRVKKDGLANVTVQRAAADQPGLPEGSVDRLLVVDTWHHLPQRAAYAAAMNRALRPGGFVMVVDFTAESPKGPPAHARLSPETVIAELQAGGFSARTVAESLPLQYVVIGQKQIASQGRPAPTARQRALVDIVKANADQARFTRGVNAHSVETLQKALAPADDPELRALLYHDDPIVVRTAASVFAARGDRGLVVLREVAVDVALPGNNRPVIDDVIWTANARPKLPR